MFSFKTAFTDRDLLKGNGERAGGTPEFFGKLLN